MAVERVKSLNSNSTLFFLFPTKTTYKGNVICIVILSFFQDVSNYFIVSTDALTHLHSTSIQGGFSHISEGGKGTAALVPPMKIYVASLFKLISLKTNGGQQGVLDQ